MESWKIQKVNEIIDKIKTIDNVCSCSINDYGTEALFSIYVTPDGDGYGNTRANLKSLIMKVIWAIKKGGGKSINIMEKPEFRGDYIIDFNIW